MMVECKYCGAESSIPTTDKVEDFEFRYFKCNKCKRPLFPNGKLEEYKPKPLKARATPAKPVPPKPEPKPKPETYKSSTDPITDKKIKGLEEKVYELESTLHGRKYTDLKNAEWFFQIVCYLGVSYIVGDLWGGWHLLPLAGIWLYFRTKEDSI